MDLLIPGALVSNTTERSDKASVVSASLALAACPDEDDELALLDEELVEEEAAEDELLDDELLEDELLEDELLEDELAVPPHPLSTTAKTARVKFRDFIVRSRGHYLNGGLSHGLLSRFAMQFTSRERLMRSALKICRALICSEYFASQHIHCLLSSNNFRPLNSLPRREI